ncbi:hypothetical protein WJX72_006742 [[Myrmecia] bisecta]|uniref:Uncharacterized protein n=1 Tax=[Myrmecia] bisecta TaxID=41462 RepID=A0AAW1QR98_9CHLO
MASVMERPREFAHNSHASAPMRYPSTQGTSKQATIPTGSSPPSGIAYQGPYGSIVPAEPHTNTTVITAPPAFQEAAATETALSYSGPYAEHAHIAAYQEAPPTAYQGRYNHEPSAPMGIRTASSGLIAAELAPTRPGSPGVSGALDRVGSHDSGADAPVYHGRLNRRNQRSSMMA